MSSFKSFTNPRCEELTNNVGCFYQFKLTAPEDGNGFEPIFPDVEMVRIELTSDYLQSILVSLETYTPKFPHMRLSVSRYIGFFYFKNLLVLPDKNVNPYLRERRIFQTDSQWVPLNVDSTSSVKFWGILKNPEDLYLLRAGGGTQTHNPRLGRATLWSIELHPLIVLKVRLELTHLAAPDPKSGVTANSTTRAFTFFYIFNIRKKFLISK